eukprot:365259-Chlamydomonas_euryale.AAC.13
MHMRHKLDQDTALVRGLVLDHGARHAGAPARMSSVWRETSAGGSRVMRVVGGWECGLPWTAPPLTSMPSPRTTTLSDAAQAPNDIDDRFIHAC